MTERLVERLKAELPGGTPLFLGRKYLSDRRPPPRLVLYPTQDTFEPYSQRTVSPDPAQQPRPRPPAFTRYAGYEIAIFGQSETQIEGILNELVSALKKLFGSGLEMQPSGWQDSESQLSSDHQRYDLAFSLLVEVGSVTNGQYVTLQQVALDWKGFGIPPE